MTDLLGQLYQALDELDSAHHEIQKSSSPDEIKLVARKAREKFLQARIISEQIRGLAHSGDFFATGMLEKAATRFNQSTEELQKSQVRVMEVFGHYVDFLTADPEDLPRA